ncbi:hypothetical protein T484DRAFT_1803922, partial [Baffinella frigidus]
VLHHPDCLDHVTKEGHQESPKRVEEESPKRVEEILKKLRSSRGADKFEEWEMDISQEFEKATLEQ